MKTFAEIYVESKGNATLTVGYGDKAGELRVMSKSTPDQQGGVTPWYSLVYDGDTGVLSLGDHMMGLPGKIVMGRAGSTSQSILLEGSTAALGGRNAGNGTVRLKNLFDTEAVVMSAETATLTLGANSTSMSDIANGKIVLNRTDGTETIVLDGRIGNLTLGGGTQDGDLRLKDGSGAETTFLDGANARLTLGGGAQDGDLVVRSASGANAIVMDGETAALTLGGSGLDGDVRVKDGGGAETIYLDGKNGNLTLGGGGSDGDITILSPSGKSAIAMSGSSGMITAGGEGVNGDIIIKNSNDVETIKITGSNGDIEFLNADVAEEFEVHAAHVDAAPPGTVMVLEDSGRLMPCREPYDPRVVGIVAGAGRFRPGIVLDKNGGSNRCAIALMGKTYCCVDADAGPIRVGDMLTTSPRNGHAMRVSDRQQAFGTVIGKALEPLPEGVGLIPVLVKPQ